MESPNPDANLLVQCDFEVFGHVQGKNTLFWIYPKNDKKSTLINLKALVLQNTVETTAWMLESEAGWKTQKEVQLLEKCRESNRKLTKCKFFDDLLQQQISTVHVVPLNCIRKRSKIDHSDWSKKKI